MAGTVNSVSIKRLVVLLKGCRLFLIGVVGLWNMTIALSCGHFSRGGEIAVHEWDHEYFNRLSANVCERRTSSFVSSRLEFVKGYSEERRVFLRQGEL